MEKLTERQLRWLMGGVGTGCFALLLALEFLPRDEPVTLLEVIGDALSMLLTIGAATGATLLFLRVRSQHEEQLALIRDLAIARTEGNGWRTKVHSHLVGLKTEMDKQFHDWGLTDAERDVGLMILKGLSHKEIATLRTTSDATVRQQAQNIYRKAGLPGKTAFSAYFLEDLLASEATADGADGVGPGGLRREPTADQDGNGRLSAPVRRIG